jgi:hypothetical protein
LTRTHGKRRKFTEKIDECYRVGTELMGGTSLRRSTKKKRFHGKLLELQSPDVIDSMVSMRELQDLYDIMMFSEIIL